jgi:hypothetical protein
MALPARFLYMVFLYMAPEKKMALRGGSAGALFYRHARQARRMAAAPESPPPAFH